METQRKKKQHFQQKDETTGSPFIKSQRRVMVPWPFAFEVFHSFFKPVYLQEFGRNVELQI